MLLGEKVLPIKRVPLGEEVQKDLLESKKNVSSKKPTLSKEGLSNRNSPCCKKVFFSKKSPSRRKSLSSKKRFFQENGAF